MMTTWKRRIKSLKGPESYERKDELNCVTPNNLSPSGKDILQMTRDK